MMAEDGEDMMMTPINDEQKLLPTSTSCKTLGLVAGHDAVEPQPKDQSYFGNKTEAVYRSEIYKYCCTDTEIAIKQKLTFLANYDCVIFTINSSILPSVVGILGGKTGRGISGKINHLGEFEQRDVVGVRLRALIVLVHDRVDLQLHVLPGHDGENEV